MIFYIALAWLIIGMTLGLVVADRTARTRIERVIAVVIGALFWPIILLLKIFYGALGVR